MKIAWVNTGDNIAANSNSWFFQYLGATATGDASKKLVQASSTYRNAAGNIIARNMAISGSRLNAGSGDDVLNLVAAYVDPVAATERFARPSEPRVPIFSCAIGTNDSAIDGFASGALYAAAVASACVGRKPGFKKVGMTTLLPRGANMVEADRLSFNGAVQDASWRASHGIDFFFDFGSDSIMGNPANLTNATYYNADQIHPTAAGQLRLVPYVTSAMAAVIASLGG